MPYEIIPYKYGFRVCKKDNKKKCFSNKPLSKKQAEKQRRAIILSERMRGGNKEDNLNKLLDIQKRFLLLMDDLIKKDLTTKRFSYQKPKIIKSLKELVKELEDLGYNNEGTDKIIEIIPDIIQKAHKERDFYPTPIKCLESYLIPIKNATNILEPTAGIGHIIYAIQLMNPNAKITAFELYKPFVKILEVFFPNVKVEERNYLEYFPESFKDDLIIINPPFTLGNNKRYYFEFLFHSLYLMNLTKNIYLPQIAFISPPIYDGKNNIFGLEEILKTKLLGKDYLKSILKKYDINLTPKQFTEIKNGEEMLESINKSLSDNFNFSQGQLEGSCDGFGGTNIKSNLYLIFGYKKEEALELLRKGEDIEIVKTKSTKPKSTKPKKENDIEEQYKKLEKETSLKEIIEKLNLMNDKDSWKNIKNKNVLCVLLKILKMKSNTKYEKVLPQLNPHLINYLKRYCK